MKAKTWILFLALILSAQIAYKITPVLAESEEDSLAIRKVMEDYLTSVIKYDLDSAMSKISTNYSFLDKDGKIVDYARFKSIVENFIINLSKKYVDYSVGDLEILKSDIQDNKATLEIEYNEKGFNLDTLKEDIKKIRRFVALAKEDGVWKITQWRQLQQSK